MQYYVYILATENNKTIYVGITNNLQRRIYEHRNSLDKTGFTSRYHVQKLVYFECTGDVNSAIEREKQIKGWNRKHKNKLIELKNQEWKDLYPSILE